MTEENKVILDTDKLPNFADTFIDINTYKRLEQENKSLKNDIKDIAKLLNIDVNEEYSYGFIEFEINELKQENKTLNYQWHKQAEIGDEWYKVAENYRSALEEIREILNKNCGIVSNAECVGIINEVLD